MNVFHCYSCGAGGGILDMIVAANVIDLKPGQSPRAGAMRWLEAQAGISHNYVLREHAQPKPHQIRGKKLKNEEQTATFFYTDEVGTILYRVVRIEGLDDDGKKAKRFEAHALRNGKWLRGMFGQPPVPYHLPSIELARRTGRPLLMVEGERDADWLEQLGFLTTSTPFGAGFNIRPDWRPYFEGVTLLALVGDGDHAGRRAVARRAQALEGAPDAIAILDPWPDHIDDGYDTTDLINELFADGFSEAEIAATIEQQFFGAPNNAMPTPVPLRPADDRSVLVA